MPKSQNITVRDVPSDTWARLKAEAALKRIKLNEMLATAIEYYLYHHKATK